MIEVREVEHGTLAYWKTVDLRRAILRKPLGLDFTVEELNAEGGEIHLAAFQNDQVIACLVLVPKQGGEIKMRQVAVDPELQGRGIGTLLVAASEREAEKRGFTKMTLHARDTAVPFYKRMDYHVVGDMFEEVTIPHYRMEKAL